MVRRGAWNVAEQLLRQDRQAKHLGRSVDCLFAWRREREAEHCPNMTGAIELAILSEVYQTEIDSIDVQTGRSDSKRSRNWKAIHLASVMSLTRSLCLLPVQDSAKNTSTRTASSSSTLASTTMPSPSLPWNRMPLTRTLTTWTLTRRYFREIAMATRWPPPLIYPRSSRGSITTPTRPVSLCGARSARQRSRERRRRSGTLRRRGTRLLASTKALSLDCAVRDTASCILVVAYSVALECYLGVFMPTLPFATPAQACKLRPNNPPGGQAGSDRDAFQSPGEQPGRQSIHSFAGLLLSRSSSSTCTDRSQLFPVTPLLPPATHDPLQRHGGELRPPAKASRAGRAAALRRGRPPRPRWDESRRDPDST